MDLARRYRKVAGSNPDLRRTRSQRLRGTLDAEAFHPQRSARAAGRCGAVVTRRQSQRGTARRGAKQPHGHALRIDAGVGIDHRESNLNGAENGRLRHGAEASVDDERNRGQLATAGGEALASDDGHLLGITLKARCRQRRPGTGLTDTRRDGGAHGVDPIAGRGKRGRKPIQDECRRTGRQTVENEKSLPGRRINGDLGRVDRQAAAKPGSRLEDDANRLCRRGQSCGPSAGREQARLRRHRGPRSWGVCLLLGTRERPLDGETAGRRGVRRGIAQEQPAETNGDRGEQGFAHLPPLLTQSIRPATQCHRERNQTGVPTANRVADTSPFTPPPASSAFPTANHSTQPLGKLRWLAAPPTSSSAE